MKKQVVTVKNVRVTARTIASLRFIASDNNKEFTIKVKGVTEAANMGPLPSIRVSQIKDGRFCAYTKGSELRVIKKTPQKAFGEAAGLIWI